MVLSGCILDSLGLSAGCTCLIFSKLATQNPTGQDFFFFSCCCKASSIIKEGSLILIWKHQCCQDLGFISSSAQRQICSLCNLDINSVKISHLSRKNLVYFQFPSIWCFPWVLQAEERIFWLHFFLVLKWKVLLDHLWLNAGFFPSMCGKDLFYSAGVKRGESDHCGKVLQLLPETVFLALTAVELGAMLLILLLKMSI